MRWLELTRNHALQAVLFDLDGVLTPTEKVHARCWKQTFDEFLAERARVAGGSFEAFDLLTDYRNYVDGKPRYDGVRSFLQARGIALPEGQPGDPPGHGTVCAVGNRKDQLVNEVLATEEIEAFPGSLSFVKMVRGAGLKTAVVSSSKNCAAVLEAAGIAGLFNTRVDGKVAIERGLAGKPAPDTFLEAARELGVPPEHAVVVEDAIAGVEAGRDGGFALVIGIARHDDRQVLRDHGAHEVVGDLQELL